MTIPLIPALLNHESRTIEGGALIIAVTSVAGALLGIVRNAILASTFGATAALDAYFAAFRIPDFIYSIFVFGVLTAGFMPVFNKWLVGEEKERGWELASAVMNIFVIVLGFFAVLVMIFARDLVAIFVPGFYGENAELVATLLQIMMIQPILLAISNVISSALHSFRRFFIASLAPLFYNLGIIIGALWLVDVWGISGLAWGVVLGAGLHLLVQLPSLFEMGFKWSIGIFRAQQGAWEVFILAIPRIANLAVAQVNFFVITAIASTLPAGTLTIYNFAADLAGFPQLIFGLSFATAVFPALAKLWAERHVEEYSQTFTRTLAEMWFWVSAAALVALAFREPLVRLTLGFGAFDETAYLYTINALAIFLLALPGQAGVVLLLRAFLAMGNTITPLVVALAGSALTIVVSFWFGQAFGAAGLALGPALAGILQSTMLLIALRRKIGGINMKSIFGGLKNGLILGIVSGGAGWSIWTATTGLMPGDEFYLLFVRFLVAIAGTLIIFGIGYLGLRIKAISLKED